MLDLSIGQWILMAFCGLFIGMAKTGVPGLGILAVTIAANALNGDVQRSAGLLLPMLCFADIFGVWWYRRHAKIRSLWELLPWVIAGMIVGVVALRLDAQILRFVVAGIILTMVTIQLFRGRLEPKATSATTLGFYGTTTGFATTVANAAGPVMSLYLLARRLPKQEFIATGAWFFLVVNLTKVPLYAVQPLWGGPRMMSASSLLIDACLLPIVFLGALSGRHLLEHLPQIWFERIVLLLAVLGAMLLLR